MGTLAFKLHHLLRQYASLLVCAGVALPAPLAKLAYRVAKKVSQQ